VTRVDVQGSRDLQAAGRRWAIATPHTLATEAGAVAFERGGNAIDAALAAAVTLAVAYPHMCGVGGDLFALVQQPAGDTVAVNGSGRAPSGSDAVAAAKAGGGEMPERGPLSVTVPGAVSGWAALHRLGASLPWADAFPRAVALAFGGVAVSRSLRRAIAQLDGQGAGQGADQGADQGAEKPNDALGSVFAPAGASPPVGALLRQPALGATLQQLAAQGAATLYGGALGDRYAAGLRAAGVPITQGDLAGHRADLGAPLRARYRDVDVLVHPPNSQGFVLLEALATVERLGIDPDPFGPDVASLALALSAAARDRDLHLADAPSMLIHPSTLLDDGHLASLADEVRAGGPLRRGTLRAKPTGDTVALVTADADGRAVSVIQSLFWGFGSGILEPETGIVAHNRGACFVVDPGHPNVVGPGKRPAHTLMPVVVQREGRLAIVSGTMGGFAQPQINASTLIRSLDLHEAPGEAVAAPRWAVGGLDREGAEPAVEAESGVPGDVEDALAGAGFRVARVDSVSEPIGHAHQIRLAGGRFEAGSDPRADGSAMAG
jgi:gamma-glutamyltranspeptidase